MKTVANLIRSRAALNPDRVALLHEGPETTYRQLDRASSARGQRELCRVCGTQIAFRRSDLSPTAT
jgi:hypothetical protein